MSLSSKGSPCQGAKKGQSCAEKEEAVSKPKRKYIRKKPLKGAGMRASGQGRLDTVSLVRGLDLHMEAAEEVA